jgi:hypothetical protein
METVVSRAALPQGIWVFRFLAVRPVVGPRLKTKIHGRARMKNRHVVQLGCSSPVLDWSFSCAGCHVQGERVQSQQWGEDSSRRRRLDGIAESLGFEREEKYEITKPGESCS